MWGLCFPSLTPPSPARSPGELMDLGCRSAPGSCWVVGHWALEAEAELSQGHLAGVRLAVRNGDPRWLTRVAGVGESS